MDRSASARNVFGYTPPTFILLDQAFAKHGSRLRSAAAALRPELTQRPTWVVPLAPVKLSLDDVIALQDDPTWEPSAKDPTRALAEALALHLQAEGTPLAVRDEPLAHAASIPSMILAARAADAVSAAVSAGAPRLVLWSHPEREGRLPPAARAAADSGGLAIEERELRTTPAALL